VTALLHAARGGLYWLGAVLFAAYGVANRLFGPTPPRLPLETSAVRRVLVIRLDLLGDAVFSIPAIDALAEAFPQARIDVLALPYTASIFRVAPTVGRVHELDINALRRPGGLVGLGWLLATVHALRRERYDVAVGLSRLMGGVFAVLSGAKWRVGHSAETYAGCYNVPLPGRRYAAGEHEVEYCLDVARALAATQIQTRPPALAPPAAAPSTNWGRYAVLVPGASNGAAKRWPAPLWSKLADRVARELGLTGVLSGSASERHLAEVVAAPLEPPPIVVAGQTSVEELPGLLAGADVVVAGDTGPLHLAGALGTPVVGIYGATDPQNTGPLGASARVVRLGIGCSPCYDLTGPAECKLPDRSVACMWGLSADRVFDSVAAVLAGRDRPS
jgi:lipopolysaccharide heptosyltransferase II